MAFSKFYLDKRRPQNDGSCELKLEIIKKRKQAYIKIGIYIKPEEWNGLEVVNRPDKDTLNVDLFRWKSTVEEIVYTLRTKQPSLNVMQEKEYIMCEIDPKKKQNMDEKTKVKYVFQQFAGIASHKDSTKNLYLATLRRIEAFLGQGLEELRFEDITNDWLEKFDNFLAKTAPKVNSRGIHLRNIRAVVNYAIDNGIICPYAFKKYKIKSEVTPKRSLTAEELYQLFNYEDLEEHQQQYVDMFKLMFFLRGINMIDLYNLKEIVQERIEYHRSKTNKFYSIKVEKEAMEIINKYKGKKALLNIADHYANYKDYLRRMNWNLKHIGKVERKGLGGKKVYTPLFPKLTTYWARHSWATIAAKLDIPHETIAAGLGHQFGNPVTSIYIDFDETKVDEANRMIIAYVLKKPIEPSQGKRK